VLKPVTANVATDKATIRITFIGFSSAAHRESGPE
jgi:hypothetical protein